METVPHIVQERLKYLEIIHTFMNTIYAIETYLSGIESNACKIINKLLRCTNNNDIVPSISISLNSSLKGNEKNGQETREE